MSMNDAGQLGKGMRARSARVVRRGPWMTHGKRETKRPARRPGATTPLYIRVLFDLGAAAAMMTDAASTETKGIDGLPNRHARVHTG